MNGKFTLEIDLRNAAMQTDEDLACALERAAQRVLAEGCVDAGEDTTSKIRDINGNVVGEWALEGMEDDDV